MAETFVYSYEHLKNFPRADQALELLKRIASLVKPIMRKHGWRLPTLAEFYPDQANLLGLNINMGQKIILRLRPAFDRGAFMQEHEIMGTMLHELTHNVHGPHDQNFYNFLAGLEKELEDLQRSGYAGEGFYSKGHRLGGGMYPRLPQHAARLRALQAAEERRRNAAMMPPGGRRLGGGDLSSLGLSPRELAALAAEMRAEDAKRCGTGDKAREEAEVEKALRESVRTAGFELDHDTINGDNGDGDDIIVVDGPIFVGTSSSRSGSSSSQGKPPPINLATRPALPSTPTWTCSVCTLINHGAIVSCEACDTPRPGHNVSTLPPKSTSRQAKTSVARPSPPPPFAPPTAMPRKWDCQVCGEKGMEHEFWTCRWCGSVKTDSSVRT